MERPPITAAITATDLQSWYWLKAELVDVARLLGVRAGGSKPQLQERLLAHLSGAPLPPPAAVRHMGDMPTQFTRQTIIGVGWRCGPALGAFLKRMCGPGFHFNAAMRRFIHNGHGQTLLDAAMCYENSMRQASADRVIPPQLEYNRHLREFFATTPRATRQQAIDAWWQKRRAPRSDNPQNDKPQSDNPNN